MPNDAQAEPSAPSGDPELDRLKERLAFYESFDQLIQSNVSQAGNLLREAIDLRESAAADADSARQQLDAERTGDRERYRALFSTMLDEITTLQGQAERLARRLTDAIDQLELELGPGAEFPPLPSSLTAELGVEDQLHLEDRPTLEDLSGDDGPDGAEPALPPEPVALLSGSEGVEDTVDEVDSATLEATIGDTDPMQAAVTAENRPASGPELPEEHVEHVPSLDDALIELPSEPDSSVDVESPDGPIELAQTLPSGSGQFVLLVHGVPRAAMALSLKRHLEMLEMVRTVEPREFAAGVLRLQLQVERDITTDDLNGWTPDSGFRTIHARSGLLEIQLLA